MEPLPETLEGDTTMMDTAIDRLERTSPQAKARMRFALHWQSSIGRHTDCYVATKLNLWRDIFPPQLQVQVMDRPVGHCASHTFAPGDLLPDWREDNLFRVHNNQFNRRFTRRGFVPPRSGRFYPKGILEGVSGVFSADRHPFRMVEVSAQDLLVDFNHPLAGKPLRLDLTIEDIWAFGGSAAVAATRSESSSAPMVRACRPGGVIWPPTFGPTYPTCGKTLARTATFMPNRVSWITSTVQPLQR